MAERCINLTAAEAKAWAAGATVLIQPCADPTTRDDTAFGVARAVKWQPGDVLIGREAWDIADINEQEVMIRYWCGGKGWMATLPTPHGWRPLLANYEWVRSPATMPKALARHRRRVVSVRVCQAVDVSVAEWRAAGFAGWMPMVDALSFGAPEAFVSVTTTEAADVR